MRADARRNHTAIVEAARKVFASQGGQASLEAIAKEAGVGIGTLYRHFPKRIDVVEAVYRDDLDQLMRAAEVFTSTLEPWEALVAWLEAYVAYANIKRTFINELHEAFDKNPNLKPVSRQRTVSALEGLLERAQAAGGTRTDINGDDLYQLMISMCASSGLEEDQRQRLMAMIIDGLHRPGS